MLSLRSRMAVAAAAASAAFSAERTSNLSLCRAGESEQQQQQVVQASDCLLAAAVAAAAAFSSSPSTTAAAPPAAGSSAAPTAMPSAPLSAAAAASSSIDTMSSSSSSSAPPAAVGAAARPSDAAAGETAQEQGGGREKEELAAAAAGGGKDITATEVHAAAATAGETRGVKSAVSSASSPGAAVAGDGAGIPAASAAAVLATTAGGGQAAAGRHTAAAENTRKGQAGEREEEEEGAGFKRFATKATRFNEPAAAAAREKTAGACKRMISAAPSTSDAGVSAAVDLHAKEEKDLKVPPDNSASSFPSSASSSVFSPRGGAARRGRVPRFAAPYAAGAAACCAAGAAACCAAGAAVSCPFASAAALKRAERGSRLVAAVVAAAAAAWDSSHAAKSSSLSPAPPLSSLNPASLAVSAAAAAGGSAASCTSPAASFPLVPPATTDSTSSSVYAVQSDLSLGCGLHALRFSLRDFDVGNFLGDGAHGCVFVGRERRSGFVCVLKCITKAHLIRGGNEGLLKKEIELQAHLKHPHICCMYTWFQTPSAIFLVMEYCLRGDLFALLDKTPAGFDEKTVARQLFQICWAIRTCHDKRIAHLDIKPENVLVDHRGHLKLADFGLSAHIGGEHRKRGVSINRGTCDYFSPEQCIFRLRNAALRAAAAAASSSGAAATAAAAAEEGSRVGREEVHASLQQQQLAAAGLDACSGSTDAVCSFDEKSDIWTIGILAFELYFKFPPFGSQCHLEEEKVMHNIRSTHWSDRVEQEASRDPHIKEKLHAMSPDFRAFVSACLKKKASLRPTAESLLDFAFLQRNNKDIISSVPFLQQPRHQQGHKGFNHAAGPWQTPRPPAAAVN